MIEYGITTSKAGVWFHVCPLDCSAYYYSRTRMAAILPTLPEVTITSAIGRLCKINGRRVVDGGFIHDIDLPLRWIDGWRDCESDIVAGKIAEQIFKQCVDARLFQIPAKTTFLLDINDQYTGRDFLVRPLVGDLSVEVKADFRGGEWGTGNLFVQTHELHHKHGERNAHWAA